MKILSTLFMIFFAWTFHSFAAVLYVDADATGGDDGSSWENAYTHPADAFANAQSGDEVWVAEGFYVVDDQQLGFNIVDRGIGVFGGFNGTETQRNQRDWIAHPTIMSGNMGDPALSNDNAEHVFRLALGAEVMDPMVLNGLIIEDGNASGSGYSGRGGAVRIISANQVIIRNCVFRNNQAAEFGGAIDIDGGENIVISQCSFDGNISVTGAAIRTSDWQEDDANRIIEIQSCLFDGNTAFNTGTVYLDDSDVVELTNCTFYANAVSFTPDAKIIDGDATDEAWVFANNILWQNNILGANQEILDLGPNSLVANSILQNSYAGNAINVFNINPQFKDPGNGDFSLEQDSPAINNGNGSYVDESLDLLRQPRVLNSTVDLGAIENELIVEGVIYVDIDANGSNDGSSWLNAYTDIGDAIDASQAGDQIWIAEGLYTKLQVGFTPWQLKNDVDIIGGFGGFEWEESQSEPAEYETVLSGDQTFDNDPSNDIMGFMQIFDLSSFIKISGLIFEDLNVNGGNAQPVLFFNSASAPEGSIGELLIERCIFRDSYVGEEQLVGVVGAVNRPLVCQMDNCLIVNVEHDSFLINATFETLMRINHCTLNCNSMVQAILLSANSELEVNNSILWNETGWSIWSNVNSYSVTVNSSILPPSQENFEGEDNLTQNPIFWNVVAGDFRLQEGSPAVNSGNNNLTNVDVDLVGNERIQGGTSDRGCYESSFTEPCLGDLDADGQVASSDLLAFLSVFDTTCGDLPCTGDFTGDGVVNVSDLLEFLTVYGTVCP